jgi:hypothetical protein
VVHPGAGRGDWQAFASVLTNTTARTDIFLTPGGVYAYRVRPCSDAGCSGWSEGAPVALSLVPPVYVEAVLSMTTVDVLWRDDANAGVGRHQVQRRVHNGASCGAFEAIHRDLPPGTTTFGDTGLTALTTYRACNAAGCSAWSSNLTLITPLIGG